MVLRLWGIKSILAAPFGTEQGNPGAQSAFKFNGDELKGFGKIALMLRHCVASARAL